jgi:ribosome-associated toxin RatA of RatAB toxin-antitoxin module
MKKVEFSYVIEASTGEIREQLSPRAVVQYMGYSVLDTERRGEEDLLRVGKYETEFTLRSWERDDGYEFSHHGSDGPFRVFDGVLRIENAPNVREGAASRVTITIRYTIGTLFSFLLNYLAGGIVKRDAKHLLQNLASDVAQERKGDSDAESEGDGGRG